VHVKSGARQQQKQKIEYGCVVWQASLCYKLLLLLLQLLDQNQGGYF